MNPYQHHTFQTLEKMQTNLMRMDNTADIFEYLQDIQARAGSPLIKEVAQTMLAELTEAGGQNVGLVEIKQHIKQMGGEAAAEIKQIITEKISDGMSRLGASSLLDTLSKHSKMLPDTPQEGRDKDEATKGLQHISNEGMQILIEQRAVLNSVTHIPEKNFVKHLDDRRNDIEEFDYQKDKLMDDLKAFSKNPEKFKNAFYAAHTLVGEDGLQELSAMTQKLEAKDLISPQEAEKMRDAISKINAVGEKAERKGEEMLNHPTTSWSR